MITYALIKGKQEATNKHQYIKAGKTKRGRMLLPESAPRPKLMLAVPVASMPEAEYKATVHMDGVTRYYHGGHRVEWQEYYLRTHAPAMACYAREGD